MQKQLYSIPRSSYRKKCIRSCKNMLCCARSLQLCPTLCNPTDYVLPGSSAHGILQARLLEWVAMPSTRESSQPIKPRSLMSPALAARFFTTSIAWGACKYVVSKCESYSLSQMLTDGRGTLSLNQPSIF